MGTRGWMATRRVVVRRLLVWLVVGLAVGAGGLVGPRPAAAQTAPPPGLVALSGTAAPAGGTYTGLSSPVLNGSGQVAFSASLTGGSSDWGIFVGAPGLVQAAALQGTAAPAGGTYAGFDSPVLNAAGQVAFFGNTTGGSPGGQGVFVGAPGAVQAAALSGTAAPVFGTYLETAFGGGVFGQPVLNGSGQVAFFAYVNNVFSGRMVVGGPGAVQNAAYVGTAAPGGGNLSGFPFHTAALNDDGQVAFFAELTGGTQPLRQ